MRTDVPDEDFNSALVLVVAVIVFFLLVLKW